MKDTARLANDLQVIMSTISPDTDLIKLQVRLEEVLVNYEVARRTVEELKNDMAENIEMFLSARSLEGLSGLTLRDDRYELYMFASFVKKACAQVTTPDVRSYLASCDVMHSTVGSKLSRLKSFFKWLVDEDIILRNPCSKIKAPKVPSRLPKYLTISELELLRESCDSLRQRALLEVFYSTGCRVAEMASLDIEIIDWTTGTLKVVGKGNKERTVYLSERATYHLKAYLKSRRDNNPALFVTKIRPCKRLSVEAIRDEITKLEKASGIGRKLHPHLFRHTYGMLKMEAGIELADLQELMGHSNPSTTLRYGSVTEERKRKAFSKYHVQ